MKAIKAINDFSQTISINPDFVAAYHNRGIILLNLGRKKEAIQDLERALIIEPNLFES